MKDFCRVAVVGVALCILGCGGGERNINYPPAVESISQLPDGQTGVFVYRENMPINPAAINIYIDGDYMASLQKNHYRYVELCPGEHLWNAVYHYDDPAYMDKLDASHSFEVQMNETQFLKVMDDGNNGVALAPVPASKVSEVFSELALQDHTISRVVSVRDCK